MKRTILAEGTFNIYMDVIEFEPRPEAGFQRPVAAKDSWGKKGRLVFEEDEA